jgi:hypothetical protein
VPRRSELVSESHEILKQAQHDTPNNIRFALTKLHCSNGIEKFYSSNDERARQLLEILSIPKNLQDIWIQKVSEWNYKLGGWKIDVRKPLEILLT